MSRLGGLAAVSILVAAPARADSWWGADKALHVSLSAGLALGATAVSAAWIEGPLERAAVGAAASFTLGVLKEVADGLGLGAPSLRDLTWNLIGAVVGATAAWAVERWLVGPLLEALAPRFAG
ncbi:MAG: hypothetical protein IAE78_06945 [Myxococcus sp.]|nr:hypothetical protein [Myxococcus sp.]